MALPKDKCECVADPLASGRVRALALGARARVGLLPEGAGRPVGPGVRGGLSPEGQLFGAGFLEEVAVRIIII